MGRPRHAIVVGLCAHALGCAQLAGIEETSGVVGPGDVSLAIERVSIGTTIVRGPQDLSIGSATFLVADDAEPDGLARVPAVISLPGVWSATIDGTPAVQFDLPDPTSVRVVDLGQRNVTLGYQVYEHPSPTAAPPGATLTVQAALPSAYAAGQGLQLYCVGTWTSRNFTGAELPAVGATTLGPVSFAYDTMTTLASRPHEQVTVADAALVLRYAGNQLTGVMEATPFDQTGADMISGTMSAVAADQMLDVQLDPAAVAARYAPVQPATGVPTMSWSVVAAPGASAAATLGPRLHAATVLATDPGTLAVSYGNPFAAKGWQSLFTFATVATRAYTPPVQPMGAMLAATLRTELTTRLEPTTGVVAALQAGLPELVTVAGVALATDGGSIPRPTQAVPITFTSGAPNALYQVQLFELAPNMAGTALEYVHVVTASSVAPSFSLPPELFQVDKLYTVRAIGYADSFPGLATGDLLARSLPVSVGYHDSGVFTVTP